MSDSTTESTQQTPPDVQALIDSAVAGLKAKNSEILGTLKATKERLAAFEGIDPEGIKKMLAQASEAEEAALIKAGDLKSVIDKKTELMKAEFESVTKAEREARERAEARSQAFSKRVLENSIRAEAGAAGLHQFAVEDALYRAGSMFVIDESGNPVAADGVLNKEGKPLTLKEWFSVMKEKAPHWFPATQSGSGAQGNTNGKGSQRTMSRTEFEALSPEARMAASKSKITII